MDYGDINALGEVDLTITGQTQGDILYFNGSNWLRLAPGTDGQSLRTGGAAANPAWENIDNATDLSIASQTTGDMLYYNGANWVRLAGGTSGDVLTANGAGAAPTYQTPAGGGGFSNVIYQYWFTSTANSTGPSTVTFITGKFKKISSVDTVSNYCLIYPVSGNGEVQGRITTTIGGQTNNVLSNTLPNTTPTWKNFDIDVSSLSDGTVYDSTVVLSLFGGSSTRIASCDSFIMFGS